MPTSIGINSCLGFSLSVTGCCQGLFLPFQHCLKTPVLRTVGVKYPVLSRQQKTPVRQMSLRLSHGRWATAAVISSLGLPKCLINRTEFSGNN